MKIPRWAVCPVLLALTSGLCWSQPFGLTNRVTNTTLRLPPNLPVFGFATSNAFGNLTFTAPVAIVSAPGETNRLFIIEQIGRIVVITNLASPTRTVFMDLASRVHFENEEGLLGLAFHPNYASNRLFYVSYSVWTNSAQSSTRHNRLSRFETSPSNPNQGMTSSEVVLINQRDEMSNHNAGDLHFGADGYLYVSLGDEGGSNDSGANSQRIDKDFFAGIIRIDVDKRPESLAPTAHPASSTNYAIPSDNPFIGATSFNGLPLAGNVRTEFWAVGLRNPWRFSFDDVTGLLYCADVGQGAREEVDIIVKGGNYGWNYREGYIARPGSGSPPAGFSSIQPILDYQRTPMGATNVGNSITGGVVYRGNRLPQLDGAYIFGDYGSGNIWALRYDGSVTTNVPFWRLTSDPGVAAFGIDPSNGDVLFADVNAGVVRRLTYGAISGGALPPTLAEAGAFTNLTTLEPHAGIVGYDVNVPYWAGGATMKRWFYIPVASTITFRPSLNWTHPAGSVWIQHFELELTNGVPESRRRLETRFLVRDTSSGVYGLTFRWDDSQTNAALVPDAGMEETFVIHDDGTMRTQTWHYPSRTECLACHTAATAGGLALGFNTPQLSRDYLYNDGVTDNQIRAMNNARYFNPNSPVTNLHSFRFLSASANEVVSVEQRVRSYLTANCVQCHRGGGRFDARIFTTLSAANIVNGPLNNNGGDTNNRVVVPGSLDHSMLLTRMSATGTNRMPPLGTTEIDTQAVALISHWITNGLAGYQSFADWQLDHFGSTNAPNAQPNADPDGDRGINSLEYLTGTDPTNLVSDAWGIGIERSGASAEVKYPRLANRGFEVQWNINLTNRASWQFLNVPENRPLFSSTNGETRIPDLITNGPPKFYRVRVYEP